MLQAGNHDGTTYRSVTLQVIKDSGANAVGSVYTDAPYVHINGQLGLFPITASSLIADTAYVYMTTGNNFVIGFYHSGVTKFFYFNMASTTSNPTWLYSTSAPS